MDCTRKLTQGVYWVGGSDRRLALFENLFPVPRGVSYNSYLILDEKTALMDTADIAILRQFMDNVLGALDGRALDYLVVDHMEPDHCAAIDELCRRFPEMKVVGNAKTFNLMRQFYQIDLAGRTVEVKEGDSLDLGSRRLTFVMAPMVHWPEVMMAYEETEGLLFSADAFGTFGALDGVLFNDEVNFPRDWLDDARRYYGNIVGKYGPQVQAAVKKLAGRDIQMICPLHGPIWRRDTPVERLYPGVPGSGHPLRLHVRQYGVRRPAAGVRLGGRGGDRAGCPRCIQYPCIRPSGRGVPV